MRGLVLLVGLLSVTFGSVQAQWQMENSTTTADLRGIDSVGGGVAWASGTNGTVVRTEDGGYLWQPCTVPPGAEHLDFRGIQAFDANTAIVMSSGKGDLSRLYKTTDGCQTWKLLFTNPDKDGFWDAVLFNAHREGWLLGDPVNGRFTLFYSDDRGRTWTRLNNKGLEAQAATQGAFAASNTSLIDDLEFGTGGKEGAFFYSVTSRDICLDDCSQEDLLTSRRHTKWAREEVPLGSHSESSGVFSLALKRNQTGSGWSSTEVVAVGGDYLKPDKATATAASSDDGGKTWHAAQTPPHGYRSAVAYDEATKVWITVGPNGTDISTDDGRNWRAVHPDAALHEVTDADRNWNALALPFVVGPHGRIGKLDAQAVKGG